MGLILEDVEHLELPIHELFTRVHRELQLERYVEEEHHSILKYINTRIHDKIDDWLVDDVNRPPIYLFIRGVYNTAGNPHSTLDDLLEQIVIAMVEILTVRYGSTPEVIAMMDDAGQVLHMIEDIT